jgi:hypothetical protein
MTAFFLVILAFINGEPVGEVSVAPSEAACLEARDAILKQGAKLAEKGQLKVGCIPVSTGDEA